MRRIAAAASAASLVLAAGCSTQSKNIQAEYVSPVQYQSYSCDQLTQEAERVSSRARSLSKDQDEEATGDAVALGVGLVLFWPALFFMMGDDHEHEIARLKGEHVALQQAAVQKNCADLAAAMSGATAAVPTQTAGVQANATAQPTPTEVVAASPTSPYLSPEQIEFDAWYRGHESDFAFALTEGLREKSVNNIGNGQVTKVAETRVKSRSETGYIVSVTYTQETNLGDRNTYTRDVLVTFFDGRMERVAVL